MKTILIPTEEGARRDERTMAGGLMDANIDEQVSHDRRRSLGPRPAG